jgi:guanosine-3',5'-bis(diphosphate) 3'-pyrophosphohydrolase
MPSDFDLLTEAVSFAARAHRHQLRKDKETPYAAHPFRVCLVVRQVFGIDDPKVLAAAVLHDTIEDTTTDYDDLAERFGDDVAGWVAALTKDMRLKDDVREVAYHRALTAAGWQVQVCKLADVYDNLCDSKHLPPGGRAKSAARAAEYLAAFRAVLKPEAVTAFAVVEGKLREVSGG